MPISILRYQRAWHTFKICHTLQIFKNDSFFIDEQMLLLSFFDNTSQNPQFKKNQISYSALPYKAYDFFPPSAKLDDWKPPVMGSLLVGFGLKSNNNFNDLLHDPDVGGPWHGGGKGQKKRQEINSCPKNLC